MELNPNYYEKNGYEAIDYIEANNLNFSLGNVIKYVTRAGHKGGEDTVMALEKARWYIDREIKRLEEE